MSLSALPALLPGLRALAGEMWAGLRSPWALLMLGALGLAAWSGFIYREGRAGAASACRAEAAARERDDAQESVRRLNRLIDAERRHRREIDAARVDMESRLEEFTRVFSEQPAMPASACSDPDRWSDRELDALRKLRREAPAGAGGGGKRRGS